MINMEPTIFLIKDYVSASPDLAAAGKAVSDDARSIIDKGGIIIFDMKGQDAVSTVFLNTSFGFLIDEYGMERVRKSFRFHNILRSQGERIRKYFNDYIAVAQ